MRCPNPTCAAMNPPTRLMMSDRHGIEIDYCPTCRGVWLDRGELDKIIERAAAELAPPTPIAAAAPPSAPPPAWSQQADPRQAYDVYRQQKSHGDHYYGKRKKSLLSELFDFD